MPRHEAILLAFYRRCHDPFILVFVHSCRSTYEINILIYDLGASNFSLAMNLVLKQLAADGINRLNKGKDIALLCNTK